jgi:hypothetical protein
MKWKYNPFTQKLEIIDNIISTIWHTGQGLPSDDIGDNGDFYIDVSSEDFDLYKKANGTWL